VHVEIVKGINRIQGDFIKWTQILTALTFLKRLKLTISPIHYCTRFERVIWGFYRWAHLPQTLIPEAS
jgi:hypothetical protein